MLIVERPQTDPYFNIAAEEYLLTHLENDCFMLWQNEPSVIVGKHQNTLAEINIDLVKQRNIPVIRRISGGGTVYHDLGNLNFTFIRKGQPGRLVDFSQFLQPTVDALVQMGIPARQFGKNDIRVNKLKISGNSEHVHRNKVLHHGTLLFNSNLEMLNNAIRPRSFSFKDKSVQSNRARVANISQFLSHSISIADFKNQILDSISKSENDILFYSMTPEDIHGINALADKKYKTWKWNYGYSPDYFFKKSILRNEVDYAIEIEVKHGVISYCRLAFGGILSGNDDLINKILIGANHNYDELKERILKLNNKRESFNFDPNILLELLF